MGPTTIMLVDDEEHLRSMLEAALAHHGFAVRSFADGYKALDALDAVSPDLVVLDVMMPGIDGFEVCRRMRAEGMKAPVVFLTARDGSDSVVRGLTIGGDDYLTKPFSLDELVARIKAVLRRSGTFGQDSAQLACGDLVLDEEAHRVTRGGEEVSLSPTEFNLLRFLLENQGRVMSKGQILDHVWDFAFDGEAGIVETYIGYLRRKVDTVEPKLIHTIRGVGYTIRTQG